MMPGAKGFYNRPINNLAALLLLRKLIALGYERRLKSPPAGRIRRIKLPGIRVTIPDITFAVGLSAEGRQPLGRWINLCTSPILHLRPSRRHHPGMDSHDGKARGGQH